MSFAHKQLLWLLPVLLPALAFFFWWAWKRKQRLMARFISPRLQSALAANVSPARQKWRIALVVAATGLVLLSLARPQWGFTWEESKQRGLDIVVAIDTSRSMLAADIPPHRLARAKLAALDLMRLAKSDRLGLVAFAGTAFLQCPLTLDEEAFRQSLNALDAGIIPQGGSSLMEAMKAARGAFTGEGDNHKVLVLFTDGEDHEGEAVELARQAASEGLRIFTVGIGTANGELIQFTDENGMQQFVKDSDGNVVKSRLNESLLQQIATVGNGFYLPLRGANTIDVLYERGLEPLPKGDISARLLRRYHERFQWPLALAVLMLITELFMSDMKRQAKRQYLPAAANRAAAATAALLLLMCVSSSKASPASAMRQYEAGRHEEALKEYQRLLERKPDDARLQYNAGTAAYRAGQPAEALRHFDASLRSPDLNLQQRAYHNLGNSLFQLGRSADDPSQRIPFWQKSVENFEAALKLNSDDADARHNLDLVRKLLEQEQQQQQQQKQDQQQDKKDSDQKEKQDQTQDQKPDEKEDSEKSQQQSQSKQDKKDEQKQQAGKDESKQDQQSQDQSGQKEQEKDKKQPSPSGQPEPGEQKESQPGEAVGGQGKMTPEQAKQLLDAARNEEKALLFKPAEKADPLKRFLKDW